MHLRLAVSTIAALLAVISCFSTHAQGANARFTLQVASFPDDESANEFIGNLERAGEKPVPTKAAIAGRGIWTRVFVGRFATFAAAREYGNVLMARRLISEYLVKPISRIVELSVRHLLTESSNKVRVTRRVNSISRKTKPASPSDKTEGIDSPEVFSRELEAEKVPTDTTENRVSVRASEKHWFSNPVLAFKSGQPRRNSLVVIPQPLPELSRPYLGLLPTVEPTTIPRLDPIKVALRLVSGGRVSETSPRSSEASRRGGLWIGGNYDDALARLRWIVGVENMMLLRTDDEGRIRLDLALLGELAGATQANPEVAALIVTDYINSNEGMVLLVQLLYGKGRYRLHIGKTAPTRGNPAQVIGSINLDNNYDSRINPYRRLGKKLDNERPPDGFESLIAINPEARWFNLRASSLVPVGHITFHELAEAYAKVELGLDYLAHESRPGAHNIALERERKLQSQRPFSDVVVTLGSNRVLRSEEEVRQFWVEGGGAGANQR